MSLQLLLLQSRLVLLLLLLLPLAHGQPAAARPCPEVFGPLFGLRLLPAKQPPATWRELNK